MTIKKSCWQVSLFAGMLLICSCGIHKKKADEKLTNMQENVPVIRMMTMGSEPECGMEAIYEQLDSLTIQDIGCIVRIDFYPWGDETELMKRLVASREYDIYGTGSWGNYEKLARQNAFLQLDEWLDVVPDLVKTMQIGENSLFDAMTVDGKVYAVPQKIAQSGGYGFFYREDLRKKWGLDAVENIDGIENYLYRAAEEFPEYAMINDKRFFQSLKLLTMGEKYYLINDFCCIKKDEPQKLISIYDCPEYLEGVKKARQWYQDEIVAQDILMVQENNTMSTLALMREGKLPLEFANHLTAINNNYVYSILESIPDCELEWLDYDCLTNSKYSRYNSNAVVQMLAVSSNTQNPKQVIRFIEKMYTDQTYYDLLVYGAEGVNYQLTEDGKVSYDHIDINNKLRGQTGLQNEQMNRTIYYPKKWNQVVEKVEKETQRQMQRNGTYKIDGFEIDDLEMKELTEKMNEIYEYQIIPLECGVIQNYEESLANIKEQLRQAGMEQYMELAQKQLDVYLMSKE